MDSDATFQWVATCNKRSFYTLGATPMKKLILKSQSIKYSLLCLFWTVVSTLRAQQEPQLDCIQVAANGDVTLQWTPPNDPTGQFDHYEIVYSISPLLTFNSVANNLTPISQNSFTHVTNLSLDNSYYYAVLAWFNDGAGGTLAFSSDTLRTIHLEASDATTDCPNCEGIPLLEWNLPNDDASLWVGWTIEVYIQEPLGTWSLITVLPSDLTEYLHYIYNCTPEQMNFYIRLVSPWGCEFISNEASGTFEDGVFPFTGILSTISINSEDDVELAWQLSLDPDVSGYIVYECTGALTTPINQINDVNTLSYIDLAPPVTPGPFSYSVVAIDACNNPDTAICVTSMYLEVQDYVDCDDGIVMSWSPFISPYFTPTHYVIHKASSVTSDYSSVVFSPIDTVSVLNYYDSDLQYGEYNFYQIESIDTFTGFRSKSNIEGTNVGNYEPPAYLAIESATVLSTELTSITVGVTPTADMFRYELQRFSVSTDSWEEVIVKDTNAALQIPFFDTERATDVFSYQYRVVVTNTCGRTVDTTNVGKTILLQASSDQSRLVNTLSWSRYEEWENGVDHYNIYRRIGDGLPELIDEFSSASSLFFEDDVSEFIDESGDFYYCIEAVERVVGNRAAFTSKSNEVNLTLEPIVWVPNSIVIGGYNPVFYPVISFADVANYRLVIFSRWGDLIFQTTNITEGWDGTMGGKFVQEGVYNYYLSVEDGRGRITDMFGFITVLNYD
jgi:gliding motility-associated-like protein